jgi:selenocysteine-specific elongation factor
MQMFRRPVESASQGDRLGICVTQFDSKLLERGLACTLGHIPTIYAAVASVHKIRFYTGTVATRSKYHISLGHETLLAKITFFTGPSPFDTQNLFQYQDELQAEGSTGTYYVLLEFERPVTIIPNCLMIGSKLDMDIHTSTCRLAFWGNLILTYDMKNYATTALSILRIFKNKSKTGIVERAPSQSSIIVKNIFKKETNLQLFAGLKVTLSTGEEGVIEGGFGQSGKIKVNIPG